jgi:flagellar biosynthetic protein FliQ
MMLVAMTIGLIVAVFQATTQINEATLTFVPKLFAVFITMLLLGPWILQVLVDYTEGVFLSINSMIT